jgi:hypothetical protein
MDKPYHITVVNQVKGGKLGVHHGFV